MKQYTHIDRAYLCSKHVVLYQKLMELGIFKQFDIFKGKTCQTLYWRVSDLCSAFVKSFDFKFHNIMQRLHWGLSMLLWIVPVNMGPTFIQCGGSYNQSTVNRIFIKNGVSRYIKTTWRERERGGEREKLLLIAWVQCITIC